MDTGTLELLLIGFISPFILFFATGINSFGKQEREISNFYWVLREKYPRSYIKQNKLIKFIRNCFGLEVKGTIHRMTCFLHYLQILSLPMPIFLIITFIFIPLEKVIFAFLILGVVFPYGLFLILHPVFGLLQYLKCKKIKRTEPNYAKREFLH